MKWTEMSDRDRDALVATTVMGWHPCPCNGEVGEQPCSPDGWFCQKCGHEGAWGDDYEHDEIPPRYTVSMDRAWRVVEKMNEKREDGYQLYANFIDEIEKIVGSNMFFDLFYCDPGGNHLTPDRICNAALKACGVKIEE